MARWVLNRGRPVAHLVERAASSICLIPTPAPSCRSFYTRAVMTCKPNWELQTFTILCRHTTKRNRDTAPSSGCESAASLALSAIKKTLFDFSVNTVNDTFMPKCCKIVQKMANFPTLHPLKILHVMWLLLIMWSQSEKFCSWFNSDKMASITNPEIADPPST